jgi:hypothetical protein
MMKGLGFLLISAVVSVSLSCTPASEEEDTACLEWVETFCRLPVCSCFSCETVDGHFVAKGAIYKLEPLKRMGFVFDDERATAAFRVEQLSQNRYRIAVGDLADTEYTQERVVEGDLTEKMKLKIGKLTDYKQMLNERAEKLLKDMFIDGKEVIVNHGVTIRTADEITGPTESPKGTGSVLVSLATSSSRQEVFSFYEKDLTAKGWQVVPRDYDDKLEMRKNQSELEVLWFQDGIWKGDNKFVSSTSNENLKEITGGTILNGYHLILEAPDL